MFGGLLTGAASYLGGLLGFPSEAANAAASPAVSAPPQAAPNAGLLAALSPDQQRMMQQFQAMQGFARTLGDMGGQRAPMAGLLPTPDIFAHRRAGRM